ncbi:MAG: hypothetical protein M3Z31_08950 [Pseudomonadota bacterium]|nr:hypothetical protein [Pseudomonadota bacterium]
MNRIPVSCAVLIAAVFLAHPVLAEEARPAEAQAGTSAATDATAPAHPGKTLLAAKCFQCHNDAMFRDQRQDRRAWEATLYRMVGRGALWTHDEIRSMSDYLATDYGPGAPKPTTRR